MLESLPVTLLVATGLGFLTGLGVGGGSLLILWLTAVLSWDPAAARGGNLLFFLPGAFLSCLLRKRQGQLPLKKLLPAVISGVIAAAVTAWVSAGLETGLLRKLFGALLLVTGVRELFYRPKDSY